MSSGGVSNLEYTNLLEGCTYQGEGSPSTAEGILEERPLCKYFQWGDSEIEGRLRGKKSKSQVEGEKGGRWRGPAEKKPGGRSAKRWTTNNPSSTRREQQLTCFLQTRTLDKASIHHDRPYSGGC